MLVTLLLARAATPPEPDTQVSETSEQSGSTPDVAVRRRPKIGGRVDVGFPHWLSDSYRTPMQARSASFGVGFTPGLRFLEVVGRWEWMHMRIDEDHPDHAEMDGHWIDFTTVGLGVSHELFQGNQSLRVGATLTAVFPRLGGQSPTVGWGGGYQMAYLFQLKGRLRIGPTFDLREQNYRIRRLDGSRTDMQVDVSYAAGVATLF